MSSQSVMLTISSSATLISFCFQSSPASGFFTMSQLFASGGQSIGTLASVTVLPMDIWGCFPLAWTGWISLGILVACEVAQSYPTLCNPWTVAPPGSSIHGIFQARVLEWVAIYFSGGSSRPRDRTWVSCRRFTI